MGHDPPKKRYLYPFYWYPFLTFFHLFAPILAPSRDVVRKVRGDATPWSKPSEKRGFSKWCTAKQRDQTSTSLSTCWTGDPLERAVSNDVSNAEQQRGFGGAEWGEGSCRARSRERGRLVHDLLHLFHQRRRCMHRLLHKRKGVNERGALFFGGGKGQGVLSSFFGVCFCDVGLGSSSFPEGGIGGDMSDPRAYETTSISSFWLLLVRHLLLLVRHLFLVASCS